MSDQNLPVTFSPESLVAAQVPIALDAKAEKKLKLQKARARMSERLAEAKMYEKFGGKVLEISARTEKKIGDSLTAMGLRSIGHGKVFITGESAMLAIAECDKLIAELRSQSPPATPGDIIDILQVKLAFSRLMLETGEALIKSTTPVAPEGNGKSLTLAFPPNQNMAIAVQSTAPTPKPAS